MYDKSCQPGDHTLGNDNTGCPSAAKLPLDGSDCRHTRRIEEAENQRLNAETGVRISVSCAVVPNSTESVETTLSFAIKSG